MSSNLQKKIQTLIKGLFYCSNFIYLPWDMPSTFLGGGGLMQQPEIDLYLFLINYKVSLCLFFII